MAHLHQTEVIIAEQKGQTMSQEMIRTGSVHLKEKLIMETHRVIWMN